jgi:antitoxin (DNA-binding transcriptional repressor) of toxin-antitoxin stability system
MQRVTREQLRAHLDEYLNAAEGGETIEVCDHERSLVRLMPGVGEAKAEPHRRSKLDDYETIPLSREVDVVALLREDRDSG